MTFDRVLAFVLFSAAAAGTPGPSNAVLTATGTNVGFLRGLPALLGVGAGMGLMMFIVAFGLGSLPLDNLLLLTAIKWLGAAVLWWFAWKIATTGHLRTNARPIGFFGAALFQWINPKSWLISASAAATFLDQSAGAAFNQSIQLALVFVLAALPSCLPWLAFGAVLQRILRSERALRIFNLAMGALLAASVLLFIR